MKAIQRRKPLTNPTAVASVLEWWNAVTKDPRFFDVLYAVRNRKKYKRGAIQESEHGQHVAAGYESGFEDCADQLTNLTQADMPDVSDNEYQTHPDLFDK